jgi:heme/copper-type cytochrome/quinol oxidase subunit 2
MFQRWMLSISMACVVLTALVGKAAAAEGVIGMPRAWEINFQEPYSPVMERILEFNYLIHVVIIGIIVLVLSILAYVIFRYNARRNPVPSKTAHNTLLEIAWTILPVLTLLVIIIPSLKLLYYSNKAENPDMTLRSPGTSGIGLTAIRITATSRSTASRSLRRSSSPDSRACWRWTIRWSCRLALRFRCSSPPTTSSTTGRCLPSA